MEGQLTGLDAWRRALFPHDSHAPSFLAEFQFYFQLQSGVIEKSRCLPSCVPHSSLQFLESDVPPSSQVEELGSSPEHGRPVAS